MGWRSGVLLAGGLIAAACGSDSSGSDTASTTGPPGVEVSERSQEAYTQCLADHGGVTAADGIETRFPAGMGAAEFEQILDDCRRYQAESVPLTELEVREVYDRWLGQAECMRGLGYDPDPAPTFETFLEDWRGDGPWSPLHGIDTSAWTPAEAQAAKDSCVLEFVDFGH